ncbi:NAD-dependent deacylase [Citricoccus sp. NPDC055426]|uniref:SIR2 family NAD-dependent protein deacylase n=1 Tax=Citricoccus sp. NPDC055426 TaxID=3155536 RepID=UPI00342F0CC7
MDCETIPGLAQAASLARSARRVVVLSGAGLSAESGVPTFREAQTGLWERYSPEQLATEDAFRADPELVWAWYRWRARLIRSCTPNAGHRTVAAWQRRLSGTPEASGHGQGHDAGPPGPRGWLTIATQNVDDLQERAGAAVAAHLHGSLFDYRCADCGEPAEHDPGTAAEDAAEGAARSEPDLESLLRIAPPRCMGCEGMLRPGIVWFGEMLPADALADTLAALEDCDLAVVVGTSATVQPAASLPYAALGAGAAVVEVNPETTDFSTAATVSVRGAAGQVLPALAPAYDGHHGPSR